MASVVVVIGIIGIVVSMFKYYDTDNEGFIGTGIISGVIAVTMGFVLVMSIICVSEAIVADDKIVILTEENTKIESQVDLAVEKYMTHESETFNELKSESVISLVSLFPELKSDELIKTQIHIYTSNNNEIKNLKLKKANANIWRWWLYFGWE